MKVGFLTLGCKVNYYETEEMARRFYDAGYEIVEFADVADIYVVNTCTVTNIADRKSRQMLHRARKNNPDSLVVAVGCYVDATVGVIDNAIDLAIANSDKEKIVSIVEDKLKELSLNNNINNNININNTYYHRQERTRAFIKIQDGCNQFCTYCLIPYVRGGGKLTSTLPEDVLEQVKNHADRACKEIVLTGIHLSSYGVDFSDTVDFVRLEGRPLADLIEMISEIDGIERIRLGSLEPRIITEGFVKRLSGIDKLCPHFHLSLQSGCDETLRRMNRHYTTGLYAEKVDMLREYFDEPAITTDVIVGFPGETVDEFETTKKFISHIGFADLHVFQYSARAGTRAESMPDQVDPSIKKERSEIILDLNKKLSSEYEKNFENKPQEILFEEYADVEGGRYLIGYNTRYVKFGITEDKARDLGIHEGDIACVDADLYKIS